MENRILLHICCAPCAIYPLNFLREKGFEVEGLFFNPNIHPLSEFALRKQAVAKISSAEDLQVHYLNYEPKEYYYNTKGKDGKERCISCWNMRLSRTAEVAKKNKFSAFTSTLLVSPYQDIEQIKQLGESASLSHEVDFFFHDFREGFYSSKKRSKELELYSQKYCGCGHSLEDRKKRTKNKK